MADGVDEGAWDGAAAMSYATQQDNPAAAYEAICAGRRAGDPALQSSWALPHHSHPGDAPNADGVRAALQRLPQTQGLTNHDAAQAHLDAHMTAIHTAEGNAGAGAMDAGEHRQLDLEAEFTLNVAERRLGLKLLTYNTVVDSRFGPIMFEPRAFGEVDPKSVRLRMDHANPPTGLGSSFDDQPDAPYMDFKVSKTQRGDEQLTLANDGVSRGVSVGFDEVAPGPRAKTIDGKRVLVYGPNSARLAEVSTTWNPTFPVPLAGVAYVLSQDEKGTGPMAEQEIPVTGPDTAAINAAIERQLAAADTRWDTRMDVVLSKFDEFAEAQRAQFTVPQDSEPVRKPKLHDWVEIALRQMRGQKISDKELKTLALDDVITSDNPGLVPETLVPDYDDLINSARPFLQSTRQIAAPIGTSMLLPIITQRAVAGTQASGEKTDVSTTATQVGTGTFPYVTVFGGADISIQMINRAERSFFDVLTGDMAMAYALDADTKALIALLTGYTDSASNSHVPDDGGTMDPEDLKIGDAWATSIQVYKRAPDTIWMNSAAVARFIDAKGPLTGAPLYSNLAAAFTAGGGPGGTLSGLRPIYVPAMDNLSVSGEQVDVIVGPSRGFVWAEDAARQLQVDVPSKLGRDIALVGGLFPAPRFADAFTVYTIAAS
jgi:phage head maturation protease